MICGVVSAASNGSGNPYSGALATMDFLSSDYWIGDTEVSASSMIDRADLITGSGLTADWNDPSGAISAIGSFLSLLIGSSWTLVVEVTETDTGSMHAFALEGIDDAMWIETASNYVVVYDQPNPGADRSAQVNSVAARPAVRRIAVTKTTAKLVLSVNGSAINSDATATSAAAHTAAALGGESGGAAFMMGYIRRIILYAEQSDAALPGLSTV